MLKDYLKITEDPEEIRQIAKRLIQEITIDHKGVRKPFYTPLMLSKMDEEIKRYNPGASPEEITELRYRFVYDFWVFGCTVDEEYYFHLTDKSFEEKSGYMVRMNRGIYVNYLNKGAGPDSRDNLQDKFRTYQLLKPYYKRDVIELHSMEDYDVFADFVRKHEVFVVKPADYSYGIGVHKASLAEYGGDAGVALQSILGEGRQLQEKHPSRVARMVIEEVITQADSMSALHKESANAIRATAVRDKDGKVRLYHPWVKVGMGGAFIASAVLTGFDAEIDPETGVVITDGFQESGKTFKVHPDSGITIKGFQIPQWDELIVFVNEIMDAMPGYRYIGWDIVLTPDGWCVMEGNYSGEFIFQMINGRGYKKEFEDLIGWKYDKDFWWEDNVRFRHN
ncbi:MAG: hypothetical protein J5585_09995 [Clostridia bacterium]|nr:hypothetical protein [Clostridia bacterium]